MKVQIKDKELHRVTTTALVYRPRGDDLEYVITKRAMHKPVMPGKWTIPGGGLHVDDYIHRKPSTTANQWYGVLEICLRREIKEEVNLKIGVIEFAGDLTFIRLDGIAVINMCYMAPYVSGKVKLDEDATDFAWVTVKEAKAYDLIDGIYGEIKDADKLLKSRGL